MKGVTFRKYNKNYDINREKNYRTLSLPLYCQIKFVNILKNKIKHFILI